MVAQFITAFVAAFVAVALAMVLIRLLDRHRPRHSKSAMDRDIQPIVFLFRDHRLIDATSPARSLLAALPGDSDWQRLIAWLGARLPDAGPALMDMQQGTKVEMVGTGVANLRLLAEDLGEGLLRLTLADPSAEDAGIVVDSLSLGAMEHELEILRSTMDHSPMLAWRQDGQGQVTWANSAYLHLTDAISEGQTVWPLPQLIDLPPRPSQGGALGGARRVQVKHGGKAVGMIATFTKWPNNWLRSPCLPMQRSGPNLACANSSRH